MMEDRFNFRVFISDANLMFYCGTFLPPINEIGKNAKLMQCTGLKDKNGKLIYEGDIIKRDSEMLQLYVIKWNYKGFWCADDNALAFAKDTISTDYEVVGNIYENSDLLSEVEG